MAFSARRFGLLASVSITAIGLAAPAQAAVNPGIGHSTTGADVSDTITICLANASCAFGVSNQASGSVTSTVNSVAAGSIEQLGSATGNLSLHMANRGNAKISSLATATAIGAPATAMATIALAVAQTGQGQGNVAIDLTNDGTLAINAGASADGTQALAAASVAGGVHQYGESDGTANAAAAIVNNGTLTIDAAAAANGTAAALAVANINVGVGNYVSAIGEGDALGSIVNSESVEVGAAAAAALHGVAGNAQAFVFVDNAFQQTGYAQLGDVALDISNDGTIAIDAAAFASAVATAPLAGVTALHATAHAANSHAFDQTATANAGNISMDFTNSGSIAISAKATAVAGIGASGTQAGTASATAFLRAGVYQADYAPSGDVAISLTNENLFKVSDVAKATGANAFADGHVEFAISQAASALGGNARATFSNSGVIDETVAVAARGTQGYAVASLTLTQAVFQSASAANEAALTLDNSGTIEVGMLATANGAQSANAKVRQLQGIDQRADAPGGADLAFANSGTIRFDAVASAVAHNTTDAIANAAAMETVQGVYQSAAAKMVNMSSATSFLHFTSMPLGTASLSFDNSGTLTVAGLATAKADEAALADAAGTAVVQHATGADANATIDNIGTIGVNIFADAIGGQEATAAAFAVGIKQVANAEGAAISATQTSNGAQHFVVFNGGVGPASVALANSGSISLLADAHALVTGTSVAASRSWSVAAATAIVPVAISQAAFGSEASASLVNGGTIDIAAVAAATGLQTAYARADVHAINQGALASGSFVIADFHGSSGTMTGGRIFQGPATAEVTNSGKLDVNTVVNASAAEMARIQIHDHGISQVARGATAEDLVTNSGTLAVVASGQVKAGSATAFIFASGIEQRVMGLDGGDASVVNSGIMKVDAAARGTAATGNATIVALVGGIEQDPVSLGLAKARLTNSGLVEVSAFAHADAADVAFGIAYAGLLHQDPLFGTLHAQLTNSGQLKVTAAVDAIGGQSAYGSAKATAYFVNAANVVADVVNSGVITAAASVHAAGPAGSAVAFAAGISMLAANYGTSAAAGSVAGTVHNSGKLNVYAKVDESSHGTLAAAASGIFISSTRDNATIVNSGTIDVSAVTSHGAPATAWGVHVVTGLSGDPAVAGDRFTLTNDGGTIIARQSTDGGHQWKHGNAIDLAQSPNASVVNLIGNGSIYGNILVGAADRINVRAGTTYFDGIIGPSSKPAVGVTAALLDSGVSGAGSLNIQDGGNLMLADPRGSASAAMYDGPAYAFVNTVDIASDAAVTFTLQAAAGGAQAVGTYSQVYADTAHLDGALVANFTPAGGIFADNYSWQNVIDANHRTGQFHSCALGGGYADSALLKLSCTYDSNANVDLALARVAFNSVAGLTGNESAVGGGLESVYRDAATNGLSTKSLGALTAKLFLMDAATYSLALDQLSGAAYAGYLKSFESLGNHYNSIVDRITDCEQPRISGSALQCRTSPFRLWAQVDHDHVKHDGDPELARYDGDRTTLLAGADVALSPQAIVGLSGGMVSNHGRFADAGGSDIKGDGWQVGAYGVYDPGSFFVKALGTYSKLNGDANRAVDLVTDGTGIAGTISGKPDVSVWTLGLHGGYRLELSPTNVVTPFLNYDYTDAKLDGFSENGVTGAELAVNGGSAKHSWLTGGVKWADRIGAIVPEASVAVRHQFGAGRASFNANFAGFQNSADFDIVSMKEKSDAVLAGLSIGGKIGAADLRLGYQGAFNGSYTEHSGSLKLVIPLNLGAARR